MDLCRYIAYLRTFGRVTLIWPPDKKVSGRKFVVNILIWLIVVILNGLAMVCLTGHVVHKKNDPVAISNSLSINGVIIDCFLQMVLVRIQWPRYQILIHEITEFMKCAKLNETIVCRKYIKRYLGYQCIFGSLLIVGILIYVSGPVTMGKRFPVDAWYPFSTDPLGNQIFVYVAQFLIILEPITYLSHDCMVVMVISYSTARFELLGVEFRKVRNPVQFRDCVKKHKKLIRFVKETERAISFVILKALGIAIIIIVASALLLSNYHGFMMQSISFLVTLCTTIRLFGFAWASDDLTEMAASLSWAIYQPLAFGKPLNLGKNISIVMQMSQRSMAFNLWGMHLRLSLRLFAQYVLKVFSIYMTMRVVVDRYVGIHHTGNDGAINAKSYKLYRSIEKYEKLKQAEGTSSMTY